MTFFYDPVIDQLRAYASGATDRLDRDTAKLAAEYIATSLVGLRPEVGAIEAALVDLSALYTELAGGQWPGWYVHKHAAVIEHTRSHMAVSDVEACKEACRKIECVRANRCLQYQTEPQSSEDK